MGMGVFETGVSKGMRVVNKNPQISKLNIIHYRGICNLELKDLGRVNVFAGVNNSGKTTILEAIGLLSNPLERMNFAKWAFMRIFQSRSLSKRMVDYLEFLFAGNRTIRIEATINDKTYNVEYNSDVLTKSDASGQLQKMVKVVASLHGESGSKRESFTFRNNARGSYTNGSGLFNAKCITTHGNFYQNSVTYISDSMLNQKKNLLLDVIRSFDTDIIDIMLKNDDILLHSESIGVQPLFSYGSGLQKAVLLAACLISAENNVILVDEIDSAMNQTAFHPVFHWFVCKCRELNVQAFVTTHSLEAIDAILDTAKLQDDIRIITLRKTPKSHRTIAQMRTGEQARSDRERFDMEMRV